MEENKKTQDFEERNIQEMETQLNTELDSREGTDVLNSKETLDKEEIVYDASELKKGKIILGIIIGLAILYRLLFFVSYFLMPGDNPEASALFIAGIVGLVLTIFIFNYLYMGRKWAKVVACIQLSVGILASLSTLISNPYSNGSSVFDLLANTIILLVLLLNKNVLSFLDYQRSMNEKMPEKIQESDESREKQK